MTCLSIDAIHPDFHAEVRNACPRCGGAEPDPQAACLAETLVAFGQAEDEGEEDLPRPRRSRAQ